MSNHNDNRPNNQIENYTNNLSSSLYLRQITKFELCKIITDKKNDSFLGSDGISINVIKN